jgi:hypothetical protein
LGSATFAALRRLFKLKLAFPFGAAATWLLRDPNCFGQIHVDAKANFLYNTISVEGD